MTMFDIGDFLSVPIRYWKRFLPAWIALAIAPHAMLMAANTDNLNFYFWLVIAPLLALAFWPVVRLSVRGDIGIVERFVWLIGGSLCAEALLLLLYHGLRAVGWDLAA